MTIFKFWGYFLNIQWIFQNLWNNNIQLDAFVRKCQVRSTKPYGEWNARNFTIGNLPRVCHLQLKSCANNFSSVWIGSATLQLKQLNTHPANFLPLPPQKDRYITPGSDEHLNIPHTRLSWNLCNRLWRVYRILRIHPYILHRRTRVAALTTSFLPEVKPTGLWPVHSSVCVWVWFSVKRPLLGSWCYFWVIDYIFWWYDAYRGKWPMTDKWQVFIGCTRVPRYLMIRLGNLGFFGVKLKF